MTAGHAQGLAQPTFRTVALHGVSFQVADDKPTFWDKAQAGLWEPGTLAALASLVDRNTVFLDIGSWVGPLSLLAAALGSRVVAVEADPRALALLEGNIAANPALADRVTVVGKAATAATGPVRLAAPRKPGDSMASVLRAGQSGSWTTPSVTPAELFTLVAAGGGGRIVVKIDIEGGEYDLLPALAPALPASVVALLVAFHPRELIASGRSADEVAAATARCAAALADWEARVLDEGTGGVGDPFAAATLEDVTLLLTRGG
jgi:FkbM family methyltransferase